MKKNLLLSLCILSSIVTYGQHEHTLHFMPDVGQASYTNPALMPNYKVILGLPGISSNYFQVANTGFAYSNMISKQEDGSTYLSLNKLVDNLNTKNYVQANANIDLLHLTFRANPRLFLSLSLRAKSFKQFMYPRDLFAFAVQGNGSYIGQSLHVSPEMESASYAELGIGGAYRVNNKLTIGARLKALGGMENITTRFSDLQITTNEDNFNVTIEAGASVLTSNLQRWDEEEFQMANAAEYMNNKGFAVDLGATYKFNERFTAGFSLVDFGAIKWTEDTYEYFLDPENARHTFSGAEIDDLRGDGVGSFDGIQTSIEENFVFEDRKTAAYTTPLPAKAYLSGTYELSPTITAGSVFFMEQYRERWNPGFSVNMAKEWSLLAASLSYSMMNETYNNVGGGISLNLTPLQIYVVSDNLVTAAYHGAAKGVLNDYVNNAQSLNLGFGINFVFGRVKSSVGQFAAN